MASAGSQPIETQKSLKSRLREGEKLYGLQLLSLSPMIAEIAASAGYDFIVLDLEYGGRVDIRDLPKCLRAIGAAGSSTVLRVPDISQDWTKKALDLGPDGIIFPMVETGRSASDAVSYLPDGYADKLLVMCQIDTKEGVEKLNEIVAVNGVDCVMMGLTDLSASLGFLRDPGNPKVKSFMTTAETAVLASDPAKGGAYLAGMATPNDTGVDLKARGYHMVVGSSDYALHAKALANDVKKAWKGLGRIGGQ